MRPKTKMRIENTVIEEIFDRAAEEGGRGFDSLHSAAVDNLIGKFLSVRAESCKCISSRDILSCVRYLVEYRRVLESIEHAAGQYRREPDL